MRRVALAANFRHAVWGPDELFYGELYASRRVPCKPTLARPGTRDAYSACVGRELVSDDGYDFLLFSLPDNDHHTHSTVSTRCGDSIAHADHSFGELVDAAGGIDAFCEAHAVILMADHAQTDVRSALPLAAALGERWRVLEPNASARSSPSWRSARPPARQASTCFVTTSDGRASWTASGRPFGSSTGWTWWPRLSIGQRRPAEAIVESDRGELRFRPGIAGRRPARRHRGTSTDGSRSSSSGPRTGG